MRTIQKKDLLERAKSKAYLTEEEAHWRGIQKMIENGEEEKLNEILAKCAVEQIA
jgi:hypothetical protein